MAFRTAEQTDLTAVNLTGTSQADPTLSGDGKRLYFAAVLADGHQHIMVATRAAASGPFGTPVGIAELDSLTGDADPSLSQDETVILFSSLRNYATNKDELFYAVRSDLAHPFGPVQALAPINDSTEDGDPFLSADGCTVYFATDRNGDALDYDLWEATMIHAQ